MTILLHICCGVCACGVAEKLLCEGHTLTGFFYNPNIHPVDEYKNRLDTARKVAGQFGFELVEGIYDREKWFERVKGYENEPEGGARCDICFRMRLEKTFEYCGKKNLNMFTTTLSVSPHKDAAKINEIGRAIGGERFLCANFKKDNGFARAKELAREWKLFHQNYCGCIYSLEEKYVRESE